MEEGSGGSGSGSGNAAGSSGGGSSNSGDSGSNTEEPRARCAEGVAGDNPVTEEACVDTTGDSQPGAADIGSSSLVTDADTDAPEPMDEAVLQQIRDKFLLSQQEAREIEQAESTMLENEEPLAKTYSLLFESLSASDGENKEREIESALDQTKALSASLLANKDNHALKDNILAAVETVLERVAGVSSVLDIFPPQILNKNKKAAAVTSGSTDFTFGDPKHHFSASSAHKEEVSSPYDDIPSGAEIEDYLREENGCGLKSVSIDSKLSLRALATVSLSELAFSSLRDCLFNFLHEGEDDRLVNIIKEAVGLMASTSLSSGCLLDYLRKLLDLARSLHFDQCCTFLEPLELAIKTTCPQRTPRAVVYLSGGGSGVLCPASPTWPFNDGFAFQAWLFIDSLRYPKETTGDDDAHSLQTANSAKMSMEGTQAAALSRKASFTKQKFTPRLFSFLSPDGYGIEAFFEGNFLILQTAYKGGGSNNLEVTSTCHFTHVFPLRQWLHIAIEVSSGTKASGAQSTAGSRDKAQLYVDGVLIDSHPIVLPRLKPVSKFPLSFCTIATNPPAAMAGLGKNRARQQAALHCQLGPFSIHHAPLGSAKVSALFECGPNRIPTCQLNRQSEEFKPWDSHLSETAFYVFHPLSGSRNISMASLKSVPRSNARLVGDAETVERTFIHDIILRVFPCGALALLPFAVTILDSKTLQPSPNKTILRDPHMRLYFNKATSIIAHAICSDEVLRNIFMSEDGLVLVEHVARFYLDRDEQLCSHEIKSICEIFMHTASEEAFRTSASMYYLCPEAFLSVCKSMASRPRLKALICFDTEGNTFVEETLQLVLDVGRCHSVISESARFAEWIIVEGIANSKPEKSFFEYLHKCVEILFRFISSLSSHNLVSNSLQHIQSLIPVLAPYIRKSPLVTELMGVAIRGILAGIGANQTDHLIDYILLMFTLLQRFHSELEEFAATGVGYKHSAAPNLQISFCNFVCNRLPDAKLGSKDMSRMWSLILANASEEIGTPQSSQQEVRLIRGIEKIGVVIILECTERFEEGSAALCARITQDLLVEIMGQDQDYASWANSISATDEISKWKSACEDKHMIVASLLEFEEKLWDAYSMLRGMLPGPQDKINSSEDDKAKTDSMDVEAAVAVLMKLTVKLFMASKRTIHDLMLVLSSEERLEALDSIGSLIDMSLKNLDGAPGLMYFRNIPEEVFNWLILVAEEHEKSGKSPSLQMEALLQKLFRTGANVIRNFLSVVESHRLSEQLVLVLGLNSVVNGTGWQILEANLHILLLITSILMQNMKYLCCSRKLLSYDSAEVEGLVRTLTEVLVPFTSDQGDLTSVVVLIKNLRQFILDIVPSDPTSAEESDSGSMESSICAACHDLFHHFRLIIKQWDHKIQERRDLEKLEALNLYETLSSKALPIGRELTYENITQILSDDTWEKFLNWNFLTASLEESQASLSNGKNKLRRMVSKLSAERLASRVDDSPKTGDIVQKLTNFTEVKFLEEELRFDGIKEELASHEEETVLLNTKKWKRYIQLLYENERLFALRSSSSKELRLQMDWKIPFRWQLDDMETCERARVKFVRDYGPNLYPGIQKAKSTSGGFLTEKEERQRKALELLGQYPKSLNLTVEVDLDDASSQSDKDDESEGAESNDEMRSIRRSPSKLKRAMMDQSSSDKLKTLPDSVENSNRLVAEFEARRLTTGLVYHGNLRIYANCIQFVAERKEKVSKSDETQDLDENEGTTEIPMNDVAEIYSRRYLLRRTALEIFAIWKQGYYFILPTAEDMTRCYRAILSTRPPLIQGTPFAETLNPRTLFKRLRLMEHWCNGRLSNFEYLMAINTIAGRSLNDLSQYPVFPWILTDYSSKTLDLNDPKIYRDLSKPMGALSEPRSQLFKDRYNTFEQDTESGLPAFHYGSHYSSMGTTLYFLLRVAPFTETAVELQGGSFDVPDRLFGSIAGAWDQSLKDSSDVKELCPEFFYLPEMLTNYQGLDLGTRQSGDLVDNVILPPWAKDSPREFISIHRRALESPHVTRCLAQWIDLVFGYKQKGLKAVEAQNVFFHLTYENAVDIDSIQDNDAKAAMKDQAKYFGQTPSQLLTSKHSSPTPSTKSPDSELPYTPHGYMKSFKSLQRFALHAVPPSTRLQGPSKKWIIKSLDFSISTLRVIVYDMENDILELQMHRLDPLTPSNPTPFTYIPNQSPYVRKGSSVKLGRQFRNEEAKIIPSPGHGSRQMPILFTRKGIVTGGNTDGSLRIFSCDTGDPIATLHGHSSQIILTSLSPCGAVLASGAKEDCSVLVWSLEERPLSNLSHLSTDIGLLGRFYHPTNSVEAICVDGDLNLVGIAGGNSLSLHDLTQKRLIRTRSVPHRIHQMKTHSRDGLLFLAGDALIYTHAMDFV